MTDDNESSIILNVDEGGAVEMVLVAIPEYSRVDTCAQAAPTGSSAIEALAASC
ncbi:hypothetical protein ACVWZ6_009170 [Bradyrhizobium sp. GM6.1]